MTGLAQKQFLDKHPKAIKRKRNSKTIDSDWPLVNRLTDQGYFSYSDYFLAETLLKGLVEATEEAALFICYLSLSTRVGHMCIIVDDSNLRPLPDTLCSPEDIEEYSLDQLEVMVKQGVKNLPCELIFHSKESNTRPICRNINHYYLQKYWHYERLFLEKLKAMIHTPSCLNPDHVYVESSVKEMQDRKLLLSEQAEAILQGCKQSFTIITGGPGTGKTYTAGHLIRIYYESLQPEEQQQCNIVLAAPTGKAAANLQKSLLQSLGENLKTQEIQAKTIHSLLLDRRTKSLSPQGFLHTSFLLIDECSMIDARMMTKLFNAIRPGTKIILLGDKYQLPPVEVGSLFADITDTFNSSVVELKKCLRADMQELVDFAQAINRGDSQTVVDSLNNGSCIKRLDTANHHSPSQEQRLVIQKVLPHYKAIIKEGGMLLDLLKSYQKYRILSPLRHGLFGVNALNALIYQELSQKTNYAPIMITKNDYTLNLFNGETGILVKQNREYQEPQRGDYAAFIVHDQESQKKTIRKVPALLLPSFEYAYAMSIHKSQGSEFEHVCLLLPQGSEIFGREVLYTAATRAKKQLTVWSDDNTIEKTLQHTSERISGISIQKK
ncbi:MAG: exodeoxyribonuclease V subunit alpha [Chlamydiota bacterium]